jgi:hypothetical protein
MEGHNLKVSENKNRADGLNILLKKIFVPVQQLMLYMVVTSGCCSLGG